MIRRRSFIPMQRLAVWTAGTLFVLCGSVLWSEFVRSQEAPENTSAIAAVSSKPAAVIAENPGTASLGDPAPDAAIASGTPSWAGSHEATRQKPIEGQSVSFSTDSLSTDALSTDSLSTADQGQAKLADNAIAERPTGWASIGDESAGSATIDDEPEWRSPNSTLAERRASATGGSRWAAVAGESTGRVSTRDATPGRVAVFDERPELTVVPRDAGSPSAAVDGPTAHKTLNAAHDSQPAIVVTPNRSQATKTLPSRPGPETPEGRDRLPVVFSRRDRTTAESSASGPPAVAKPFINERTPKITSKTTRPADKPKPSLSDVSRDVESKVAESSASKAAGELSQASEPVEVSEPAQPMPVTSSLARETVLPIETAEPAAPPLSSEPVSEPDTSVATTADTPKQPRDDSACDNAACCDEKALAEHTIAASPKTDDASPKTDGDTAQPGWVTLDLGGETGEASVEDQAVSTLPASVGDEDPGDEPRIGGAPPVEGWRPHPTATLVEVVPTAVAPELQPVDMCDGHESLPVPPRRPDTAIRLSGATASLFDEQHALETLSDGPALAVPTRVAEKTTAVSTLLSDDTGRRKGSDLTTPHVNSPRRVSLFEADDPPAFEPPPTPDGTEPPEPGNGGPVDLAPLLAPSADPGDNPALGGPQLSGPGNARQKAANPDEQKLGEAPEDTSLRFLRQQTVLLKPGEMQFDVSLQYLNDKVDFVGVQQVNGLIQIAEAERRQRLLMVPLQLRVGIFEYTQAFVNVPFGWSNSESAFLGQDSATSTGGIGDVSAGILKQLVVGNEFYPDVLASISFSAPTGESNFLTALTTPGSNLGEGFWSLTSAITFIQNYDPLVLFYGGGYRQRFQEKFNGTTKVKPGSQFIYRFGVGFAVNPNVTLSATFNGSFIGEYEVNGTNVGGSTQEPMQVRLAATINKRKVSKTHSSVKLVEPFVTFGLNDDAIDTIIGATWTF